MTRRTIVLAVTLFTLAGMALPSALPAVASHSRQVQSAPLLDPTKLALPDSALPPGAVIDHAGISDNSDADGNTTPPDGFKAQLKILHQNFYEVLGRINGYRMDFHYTLNGAQIGTEYLASIFADETKAKAAMQDAIGPGSLISYIGKPLANQCTAGDVCSAYYGPNPGTPNNAVVAIFVRGPILIETASQVPAAQFTTLEPAMETALYGMLGAADVQVQIALNPNSNQPTATATPPPATATPPPPTATPTPKPKKHCKKGYKLSHGKCKKVKKKKGH